MMKTVLEYEGERFELKPIPEDDDCEDQGMGLPKNMKCRCGNSLRLKPLGWTCDKCGTGYGR